MRRALVIGASGGIGAALCSALEADGVETTRLSRSSCGLDLAEPTTVKPSLISLDGPFDTVIVATGILAPQGSRPEKSLDEIDAEHMMRVFAVNAIGPALVLKHLPKLLPDKTPCKVAVISARVGSIGDNALGGWYSYRASKAATNQIVRTAAIEIGRRRNNAIVVALHPGTVDTPFTEAYVRRSKFSPSEAASNVLKVLDQNY